MIIDNDDISAAEALLNAAKEAIEERRANVFERAIEELTRLPGALTAKHGGTDPGRVTGGGSA